MTHVLLFLSLAWLQPDEKNVMQVSVKTLGAQDDAPVSADKKRGIRIYQWAEDSKTLLYLQDTDGDENFHVYAVDLTTKNTRDLTPFQNVRAAFVATPEGGEEVRVRETAKLPWKSLIKVGPDESLAIYGFTLDGKGLLMGTSVGSDTMRVVEKNLKTGSERVLAKSETSDPTGIVMHPTRFVRPSTFRGARLRRTCRR